MPICLAPRDDGDVLLVLDAGVPHEERFHVVLVRENAIIDHFVIGALMPPTSSANARLVAVMHRG